MLTSYHELFALTRFIDIDIRICRFEHLKRFSKGQKNRMVRRQRKEAKFKHKRRTRNTPLLKLKTGSSQITQRGMRTLLRDLNIAVGALCRKTCHHQIGHPCTRFHRTPSRFATMYMFSANFHHKPPMPDQDFQNRKRRTHGIAADDLHLVSPCPSRCRVANKGMCSHRPTTGNSRLVNMSSVISSKVEIQRM